MSSRAYHIHTYFDAETRASAENLREELADHRDFPQWIGPPLKLDLEFLNHITEINPNKYEPPAQ